MLEHANINLAVVFAKQPKLETTRVQMKANTSFLTNFNLVLCQSPIACGLVLHCMLSKTGTEMQSGIPTPDWIVNLPSQHTTMHI